MRQSRLSRVEEKKAQKRLYGAMIATVVLLVFLGFFGLKILVGFSLLVDRIRGTAPQTTNQQEILLAPTLDQLPEATPSSTIKVSGVATPNLSLTLFVNDEEFIKIPVPEDGIFEISEVTTDAETLSIYATVSDALGNTSPPSNTIQTMIDKKGPDLEVTKPQDAASINDGTHKVQVEGKTEEETKVTINGRLVVVRSGGSFSYSMPINDGENMLVIIARDAAGNETKIERKVMYVP